MERDWGRGRWRDTGVGAMERSTGGEGDERDGEMERDWLGKRDWRWEQ